MREHALAAVAVLTAVAGFPQTDAWRPLMDEGATAELTGDYVKAAASYRQATEIAERLDRRDKRRVFSWNSLGTMYDAMGRFAEAESAYRRGLREAEETSGKAAPEYGLLLENLGALYVETGQTARGEKMTREALAIQLAAEHPDPLRIAIAKNTVAEVLSFSGKNKEAGRLLTEAVAVLEKDPDEWGETAIALNNLGVLHFRQKNSAEAERLLLRSLATMEQHLGPDHPMLTRTLSSLASLASVAGRRDEAGERLRRALDIAERRLGEDHPVYGAILGSYAAFLRQGGEKSRAKAMEARSSQILKDSVRRNGLGGVIDISSLRRK